MKTYTLDFKKWRAGGGSMYNEHKNIIGAGVTKLLNSKGYMCCLGQFSLQCGFTENEIIGLDCPEELGKEWPDFNKKLDGFYSDTPLANDLILINDNRYTTWQEKIIAMRAILAKHEIDLNVINSPEPI